jgi:branched-chain amino acid transport system permease protein
VGVVFACLIGGAGNLYGAIIGGVAYMMISNYLAIYIQRWEMFLGISLLIIVFKFRKGIWGNIQNISEYFQRPKEVRPVEEKRA